MEKSGETPKWETLDRNILSVIFNKLDAMDLIMGASRVCISWFVASHDKSLWQTVDLAKVQQVVVSYSPESRDKVRPVVFYNHRVDDDEIERGLSFRNVLVNFYQCLHGEVEKGRSLREVLIEITKLSDTAPKNLFFNSHSYIKEKDLMMPNIEKLVLPRWCYHNKKSFRFAFSRWKNLKTLIIAHDHNLNGGFEFQAVGENCINLTNLKYLGYLHEYNAEQIVRCFQKLKRLSLRCSFLCVRGVLSLITGLQNHVILNLTHCVFHDVALLRQNVPAIGPVPSDDLVQAATQKLDKLIKCSHDCSFCKAWWERLTLTSLDKSRWHPYDKDWRNDEIEEFVF
ncbi:unnamed protein product [Arabidopsis lyrata]|nr:unnamed protein product [Arabidopsis lyrata]